MILSKEFWESCTSSDEQLLYKISFFLSELFFLKISLPQPDQYRLAGMIWKVHGIIIAATFSCWQECIQNSTVLNPAGRRFLFHERLCSEKRLIPRQGYY